MKKQQITLLVFLLTLAFLITLVAAKPSWLSSTRAVRECRDGIDNDGDGYIDLNDPGCANKNDLSELNPAIECDDGTDNDGDSAIDYNDAGCSSPTDTDETNCGDSVCEGGEVCDVCIADCGYCNSCTDTDGGFNTLVKGSVFGYLGGDFYNYTDYCTDNLTVKEYYCWNDQPYNANMPCLNMTTCCSDGKCI